MSGFSGRVAASVGEMDAAAWDSCLPGEAECHAYHAACDAAAAASGIGLRCGAAVVEDARGVAAVAPVFRLNYRLDTPLQGRLRDLGDAIFRRCPGLVTLKALCIGSPYAERCHLGFAPRLDAGERRAAAQAMLGALDRQAASESAHLVAWKDLAPEDEAMLGPLLTREGFGRLGSLPVAVLDLPFTEEAQYLASLSSATRKDIRRKLAKAKDVAIVFCYDITEIEAEIEALYESTRRQSGVDYGDLEILPPSYFAAVSRALGERAVFILYWVGGKLAAFNLLLVEEDRVVDKFLGMRYPLGREHNIYAVSWMANVRFCIRHRIRKLQSGQTAYASKLRFGSQLVPSTIYFRHRSAPLQWALRSVSPWLSFARFDPDLAALARRRAA